uniref:Uncharacterized protein n=1 Tax=Arundo donax TaxID=35708 RepID=A0A0A9EXR0_ARUDO
MVILYCLCTCELHLKFLSS